MSHNNDCNINSNNFKPNGSYNFIDILNWSCGANVYKNTNDAEVLYNMINAYKTALLFGYKKDKKKYKLANIDYSNGCNYYKYYNKSETKPYTNENPPIYLSFHGKSNSEPHLHMHTFYDKDNNTFESVLKKYLFKNKTHFIDKEEENKRVDKEYIDDLIEKNEDLNGGNPSNIIQKGGAKDLYEEIFGLNIENKYKIFDHNYGDLLFVENDLFDSDYQRINKESWEDYNKINSKYYNEYTDWSISFEYAFKKVIGISDDDDIMKCQLIFPEPFYADTIPHKLYNDQHKLYDNLIKTEFTELFNSDYKNNIKPFFNINYYEEYNNTHIHNFEESSLTRQYIYSKQILYKILSDETTISRESTIRYDNIMILCLQFAFINNLNIGGYYSHSSPVFNRFKNITHPEICLFNSVDYIIKFIKNAPYTNCNIDNNNIKYKKYLIILILYFIKFYNQYNKKINISNNIDIIPGTIIDNFFDQTQIGGNPLFENIYKSNRSNRSKKIDTKSFQSNIENDIKIKESINILIEFINDMEENDKYIDMSEDDINFLINIIKCLHLNIKPTNGQELYLTNK